MPVNAVNDGSNSNSDYRNFNHYATPSYNTNDEYDDDTSFTHSQAVTPHTSPSYVLASAATNTTDDVSPSPCNYYDRRRRSTVLAGLDRGDFATLELELSQTRHMLELKEQKHQKGMAPWCFPIGLIAVLTLLVLVIPPHTSSSSPASYDERHQSSSLAAAAVRARERFRTADDECIVSLVESIPDVLNYTDSGHPQPSHATTFDTWMRLINITETTMDIASFYWTLRGADFVPTDRSAWQGNAVYNNLLKLGQNASIRVRIVANAKSSSFPQTDTDDLQNAGAAAVRYANFTRFLGAGILHTKLWISDHKHFYVGSANTDWRSLTQVKELGMAAYNCPTLAEDMWKIFQVYWLFSKSGLPPKQHQWPSHLFTHINMFTPVQVSVNSTPTSFTDVLPIEHPSSVAVNSTENEDANSVSTSSFYRPAVYIASSPPPLNPVGRTNDIDALLRVIQTARQYINIAVMDYAPVVVSYDYSVPSYYWPIIDDALRNRIYGNSNPSFSIRLMVSKWKYTAPAMLNSMKSLLALNGMGPNTTVIQIRWFEVPGASEQVIPYTRVNHNKYMVTDQSAYISTSNWSGDYFLSTGGVSVIFNETHQHPNASGAEGETMRAQLLNVFERDWYSMYATDAQ